MSEGAPFPCRFKISNEWISTLPWMRLRRVWYVDWVNRPRHYTLWSRTDSGAHPPWRRGWTWNTQGPPSPPFLPSGSLAASMHRLPMLYTSPTGSDLYIYSKEKYRIWFNYKNIQNCWLLVLHVYMIHLQTWSAYY